MRIHTPSVHAEPSPVEVLKQLDRILSSSDFVIPDRGRRFLEFIVHEKLEGRASHLKAFTIAQAVFERGVNFNPQNDPCVRMQQANSAARSNDIILRRARRTRC